MHKMQFCFCWCFYLLIWFRIQSVRIFSKETQGRSALGVYISTIRKWSVRRKRWKTSVNLWIILIHYGSFKRKLNAVHEGTLKIGSLRLQYSWVTNKTTLEPSHKNTWQQITNDRSLVKAKRATWSLWKKSGLLMPAYKGVSHSKEQSLNTLYSIAAHQNQLFLPFFSIYIYTSSSARFLSLQSLLLPIPWVSQLLHAQSHLLRQPSLKWPMTFQSTIIRLQN